MKLNYTTLLFALILGSSVDAEPLLLQNKNNNLALSIYNQNLALVKDSRFADLRSGTNEVIFDGVAQRIQSETAIIYGDGIKINEQIYSYNLMSYDNLLKRFIGKDITAVRTNPENGKNIYEHATLIGTNGSQPILLTEYGIDAAYPGRIIFDKIPAGLSDKPILTAKLNANSAGNKTLNLAYLTDGLSWKTDYVANVNSADKLNLTGWVTITNESGIDYENAKIQLIAGDVNIVRQSFHPRHNMMLMTKSAGADFAANESITPETINSYELYTLPTTTSIKDHQNKQVALIEKNNVKYDKELELTLPFYFGDNSNDEFEKLHPAIIYIMSNTTDSNLGISLPAGVMRFYQNDRNGNLQFIGSSSIGNTAKEDTLRLNLGDAFNVSLNGKINKIKEQELSKTPQRNLCYNVKQLKIYEVSVTINNAEDTDNQMVITQTFPQNYKIAKENIQGSEKNATTRQWYFKALKNAKNELLFTVEIPYNRQICN